MAPKQTPQKVVTAAPPKAAASASAALRSPMAPPQKAPQPLKGPTGGRAVAPISESSPLTTKRSGAGNKMLSSKRDGDTSSEDEPDPDELDLSDRKTLRRVLSSFSFPIDAELFASQSLALSGSFDIPFVESSEPLVVSVAAPPAIVLKSEHSAVTVDDRCREEPSTGSPAGTPPACATITAAAAPLSSPSVNPQPPVTPSAAAGGGVGPSGIRRKQLAMAAAASSSSSSTAATSLLEYDPDAMISPGTSIELTGKATSNVAAISTTRSGDGSGPTPLELGPAMGSEARPSSRPHAASSAPSALHPQPPKDDGSAALGIGLTSPLSPPAGGGSATRRPSLGFTTTSLSASSSSAAVVLLASPLSIARVTPKVSPSSTTSSTARRHAAAHAEPLGAVVVKARAAMAPPMPKSGGGGHRHHGLDGEIGDFAESSSDDDDDAFHIDGAVASGQVFHPSSMSALPRSSAAPSAMIGLARAQSDVHRVVAASGPTTARAAGELKRQHTDGSLTSRFRPGGGAPAVVAPCDDDGGTTPVRLPLIQRRRAADVAQLKGGDSDDEIFSLE